MNVTVSIIIAVITLLIGTAGGYMYRKQAAEKRIGRTEAYAKNLLEEATRKADEKKKETILEAKEEVLRLKDRTRRGVPRPPQRKCSVQSAAYCSVRNQLDKKVGVLETREGHR